MGLRRPSALRSSIITLIYGNNTEIVNQSGSVDSVDVFMLHVQVPISPSIVFVTAGFQQ